MRSQVRVSYHFVTLFGATGQRIGEGWKERGGFNGFSDHVLEVCAGFPHVEINPQVWKSCIPKTSATGHLFLKAAQNLEAAGELSHEPVIEFDGHSIVEELAWRLRCAFFRDAIDIGRLSNLYPIGEALGIPQAAITEQLDNGAAFAALEADAGLKELHRLEGSPTYLLNNGRQKLYGNVGYRIIEANIAELLERPESQASWC
jgi:hypothetical protein